MATYFDENEGLVWLHQESDVLRGFLEYRDQKSGDRTPFGDAPLDFWNARGQQEDKPLYNECPVVFYVGISRYDKRLFATARIKGNGPFNIVEVFGASFRGIRLPRQRRGYRGKEYLFPDGIWLTDVEYIEPPKRWPPTDPAGAPRGSCIIDGARWQLLKSWITGTKGK